MFDTNTVTLFIMIFAAIAMIKAISGIAGVSLPGFYDYGNKQSETEQETLDDFDFSGIDFEKYRTEPIQQAETYYDCQYCGQPGQPGTICNQCGGNCGN